jgi:O-acetylhomoserine (thiol)-lyase
MDSRLGTPMAPFNAFLAMVGCETLHIRMERHGANALALAQHLEQHPLVSWVNYPDWLPAAARLAQKYLRSCSGVLCFGVKGGSRAGEIVMNSLKVAAIGVLVADLRTCVLHPPA